MYALALILLAVVPGAALPPGGLPSGKVVRVATRVDYLPGVFSYTPGHAVAVSYAPGLSKVDTSDWAPRQIAPFAPGSTRVETVTTHTVEAVRTATAFASQMVTSWRQPIGHTHTCPRCGDTWDHAKNTGHTCQECGAYQATQDRVPRLVPVKSFVRVYTAPVQAAPVYTYTLPTSAVPGCVGGNCPLPRR